MNDDLFWWHLIWNYPWLLAIIGIILGWTGKTFVGSSKSYSKGYQYGYMAGQSIASNWFYSSANLLETAKTVDAEKLQMILDAQKEFCNQFNNSTTKENYHA